MRNLKHIIMMLAVLLGFAQGAYADKTFYVKVSVKATPVEENLGRVGVTLTFDEPDTSKLTSSFEHVYAIPADDDATDASLDLYLWSYPNDGGYDKAELYYGDEFIWDYASPNHYYNYIVTASSTDPNNPTEADFTFAFGKTTKFYYDVTSVSDGHGLVANFSGACDQQWPKEDVYKEVYENKCVLNNEGETTSAKADFTLLAQPDTGYYLDYWTDEAGNHLAYNSSTLMGRATLASSSQDETNPAKYTLYAHFKEMNKYFFRIIAHSENAKSGNVSVSEKSYEPTGIYAADYDMLDSSYVAKGSFDKEYYLYADPAEGYYLDYWTNDATGEKLTRVFSGCSGTGKLSSTSTKDNPATYSYTAHFKQAVVFIGKENDQYGDLIISDPHCKVGDKITLKARPYTDGLVKAKFISWIGPDGKEVSTDTAYTFTVTEANKGKYIAKMEGTDLRKGGYYAFVNHGYVDEESFRQLGLLGISQTRIGEDNRHNVPRYPAFALMTISDKSERMHASPAFVIKLSGDTKGGDGGILNADMMAQDITVSVVAAGIGTVGIKNPHLSYKGLPYYYITGQVGAVGGYVVDWGDIRINCEVGGPGSDFVPGLYNGSAQSLTDHPYWWDILPYTEDDDTRAYFGAMPSDSSKIGDYYYTTMYTAFPYRCLDGVKAYTVDQIKDDGTLHLNRIANDIVPARTPVILECKTTHPKTNRLLPLNDDVAPLKGTNYLRGEMWILKDENLPQDSFRTRFNPQTMRVMSYDGSDFRDINNYGYYIKEYMKNASGTTDNAHVAVGTTGIMPYIENNTCWLDVSSIANPLDRYTFNKAKLTIDGEDINAKNWETSIENHAGPADVTLTRDMSEADQWYTICLPFDLTDSKLRDAFGAGYDLEDFGSSTLDASGNVSIQFKRVKSLEAGKPYLVKITKGFTKHTFWGVNMQEAPTEFTDLSTAGHQMKGTENYETEDIEKYGKRSRFFYHLELITPEAGKGQIRPTRCFFLYPDNSSAAKSVSISTGEGGTTTSISKVSISDIDPTDHARIYNLQGQYMGTDVSKLPTGVYIQNGRKFVK